MSADWPATSTCVRRRVDLADAPSDERWVMRLRGRKAVVTGGGRGIGRAVAVRFAEEGAHVAVVARTRHELEETAHAVESKGGTALKLPCDVRSADQIERMAKTCLASFRVIDVLVNNAGVFTAVRRPRVSRRDL